MAHWYDIFGIKFTSKQQNKLTVQNSSNKPVKSNNNATITISFSKPTTTPTPTPNRGTGYQNQRTQNSGQKLVPTPTPTPANNQKTDGNTLEKIKRSVFRNQIVKQVWNLTKSSFHLVKNYVNNVVKLTKSFEGFKNINKLNFKEIKKQISAFLKSDEYKNASEEAKREFHQYFSDAAMSCEEQVKKYEELCKKNGTTPKRMQKYIALIKFLKKEAQVKAVKCAITNGSKEQQKSNQMYVAVYNCEYNPNIQADVDKMLIETQDKDVIKLVAANTHRLDSEYKLNGETNQTRVVKMLQDQKLTGLTKKEDRNFQISIDKNIIDQYGQFAQNSQLSIHDTMAHSKINETAVYAASNIWQFKPENQAKAFDITIKTQNEDAINVAVANWDKYDKNIQKDGTSAQEKIGVIVNKSDYDAAKKILADVIIKTETEPKADGPIKSLVDVQSGGTDKELQIQSQIETQVGIQREVQHDPQFVIQSQSQVKTGNGTLFVPDYEVEPIQTTLVDSKEYQNLTPEQQLELMKTNPRADVIIAVIRSNPSVLSEISKNFKYYFKYLSEADKKAVMIALLGTGKLSPQQVSALPDEMKEEYAKYVNLDNDSIDTILEKLTPTARAILEDRLKKQGQKGLTLQSRFAALTVG